MVQLSCTARRSNQLVLKETNPEYSLEELMLKLQYFGHLVQRANSPFPPGENSDAGKDGRQNEKREAQDNIVR